MTRRCEQCGGQIEVYGDEPYCPDCLTYEPAPGTSAEVDDFKTGEDLDGDGATALRDAGWGTDEDYGIFAGDDNGW